MEPHRLTPEEAAALVAQHAKQPCSIRWDRIRYMTAEFATARDMLINADDPEFLFDDRTGLWMFGMYAEHERVCSALLTAYGIPFDSSHTAVHSATDVYITNNCGFFRSGCSKNVYMGETYSLDSRVKRIFYQTDTWIERI